MCRASLLLAELRGGVQGSAYELDRAFISSLRISLPMPLWIWAGGEKPLCTRPFPARPLLTAGTLWQGTASPICSPVPGDEVLGWGALARGCAPPPSDRALGVAKVGEIADSSRDAGGPFLGDRAGLGLLPKADHHGDSFLPLSPARLRAGTSLTLCMPLSYPSSSPPDENLRARGAARREVGGSDGDEGGDR